MESLGIRLFSACMKGNETSSEEMSPPVVLPWMHFLTQKCGRQIKYGFQLFLQVLLSMGELLLEVTETPLQGSRWRKINEGRTDMDGRTSSLV